MVEEVAGVFSSDVEEIGEEEVDVFGEMEVVAEVASSPGEAAEEVVGVALGLTRRGNRRAQGLGGIGLDGLGIALGLAALVVVAFHFGIESEVLLLLLVDVETARCLQIGSPCLAFAHADGALRHGQRFAPFVEGRMEPPIALGIVEVGFSAEIHGFGQDKCIIHRPFLVARTVIRLREGGRSQFLQELLTPLVHGLLIGRSGVFSPQRLFQFVTLRLVVDFSCHTASGQQRLGRTGRTPLARLPHMTRLVHVVRIRQQREAQTVGEAQQEATSQPSLVRSSCHLRIGDVALAVLVFQYHIHHITARLHIVAQCHTSIRLLLIDFQVLHRIVGQVLHQHLFVAAKERA